MINPQNFRPPHVMLVLLILAITLNVVLKPSMFVSFPYNWIGAIIFLIGFILMMQAHNHFTKNETPVTHAQTPTKLVIEGPYKFTRNPMYVAGALIFLGIAVMVGTWPFVLSWLLMGAILNWIYIPWEEKRMEELFGKEYLSFKKQKRRWI